MRTNNNMYNFTQQHIEELYQLDSLLGCQVLLPPAKGVEIAPFICIKDYRELGGDVRLITQYLMEQNFSFYFKDENLIIILGKLGEQYKF
jgi:hypothetical protein